MRQRACTLAARCCTWRETGPVDVEDEASWCAMEATDEIKEEGTETMLTTIPDPPEAGGVEAMRTDKVNLPRNSGTMGRKEKWIRIWFHTYRQRKSATIALRRKIRKSQKRVCLRYETRRKIYEEDHPEVERGVVRRLQCVKSHDVPHGVILVPGKTDATRSSRN